MNNNYNIIRTIFENVFQRVLECKDNDTGEIFYSNIITSQRVINLINLEELKRIPSNVLECYNTEDRIYIYTKPLNTEYVSLRDHLANSLTLKQQFSLSESVINLAQGIFNLTDVVQQKILDLNKVYVDKNNHVIVDCNLIFEQEYDISDNETFKRLGNMIHFIFSGNEIVDYNISDSIPPDILKIIVRCLTKEYLTPNEVLLELKKSPIYSMIFGIDELKEVKEVKEKVNENKPIKNKEKKSHNEQKHNEQKHSEQKHNEQKNNEEIFDEVAVTEDFPDENKSVFDIYLKEDASEEIAAVKKAVSKKDLTRAVVSIIAIVIVLLVGNKFIKNLTDSKETNQVVKEDENNKPSEENKPSGEDENKDNTSEPQVEITDSTEVYFNEQLLNNVGYTGNKAEIDTNIYVEGKNSLVIANEGEEKVRALFAVIDFKDEKFNYMLKKQIGISAKLKSESDVTTQVVLEAYKDGKVTSNFHTSIQVFNDMWSQLTVPINVTDADSLNIYIEYEGKNKVWVDSIFIDVIK